MKNYVLAGLVLAGVVSFGYAADDLNSKVESKIEEQQADKRNYPHIANDYCKKACVDVLKNFVSRDNDEVIKRYLELMSKCVEREARTSLHGDARKGALHIAGHYYAWADWYPAKPITNDDYCIEQDLKKSKEYYAHDKPYTFGA